MNRILLIVITCLIVAGPIYGDELDRIIEEGLSNSRSIRSISNTLKVSALNYQNTYWKLLPGLSVSAGADAGYSSESLTNNYAYSLDVSFSKSFGDVESTISGLISAKNSFQSQEFSTEIARRNYIDSIIQSYSVLAVFFKQREVKEKDIESSKIMMNIMNIKQKNGQEILLNILKLSNNTLLKQEELENDQVDFENNLAEFENITGVKAGVFDIVQLKNEGLWTEDFQTNNQMSLDLKTRQLSIENNLISLGRKEREAFLPIVGLSGSYRYSGDSGKSSMAVSAGVSFSALEFFQRQNEAETIRLQIKNMENELSNTTLKISNTMRVIKKQMEFLERKITLMEENLKLSRDLQKYYKYQYETDKIDFYEMSRYQNSLVSEELDLLSVKSKLYIIQKRVHYGIAAQ